jgi:D-alanyl-lipoteichoic acid acyltransferase DltB (MBOAT superfamily)
VLFNSYPFLGVFLPIVLAGFFALRWQVARLVWIVVASYVFYGYAKAWFPALMAGSTVISFTMGLALARVTDPRRRRAVLATGIVGALGLLVYFKYAQFAAGNASSFLSVVTGRGLPSLKAFTEGIALPVGISFYTFEAISYMVDVFRGDTEVERNPLRYAFFISFFPHLIAGPIVRYRKLEPQLHRFYRLDPELLLSGLLLFSLGLAKKVLVADQLGRRIDPLLAHPGSMGVWQGWAAALGYAFQIYFDFAGYCDMALGLARMVGIELPWNFDRPYRAHNPREFWRRWNVTLSSWLRDYLYIPLGGNRHGELRRDGNLLATMGIGGLWHGASFTFLAWGLWHGMLLVGHRRLSRLGLRVPGPVAVALTFFLVMIATIFFRMKDAHGIAEVLLSMAGAHGIGSLPHDLVPFLLLAGGLTFLVPEEWRWSFQRFGVWRIAAVGLVAGLAVVLVNETQRFIYFKF